MSNPHIQLALINSMIVSSSCLHQHTEALLQSHICTTKDWRAISLSLPSAPLFDTDGINGKVSEMLNVSLTVQIGFWTGQVLKTEADNQAGVVILGQDSQNSSELLAMALATGLTAAGLDVWHLGLCTTPAVTYLTSTLEAIGGVMISASDHPPEDNGIKFFNAHGAKLSRQLQAQIEAGLRGKTTVEDSNDELGIQHYCRELLDDYERSLSTSLPTQTNLTGLKVVLDLPWGATGAIAPKVFTALGVEVICLHEQGDGNSINIDRSSTNLALLQTAVEQYQADLGFAFDGDGDRVMAVDDQGRVVSGDHILYIWGQQLRQQGLLPHDTIVTTLMANLGFEEAWLAQGGKLVRISVEKQNVHAAMMEIGAMLGSEQSGNIFCPHYSISSDGLLTALHLATIVKQRETPLSAMVDQSFSV